MSPRRSSYTEAEGLGSDESSSRRLSVLLNRVPVEHMPLRTDIMLRKKNTRSLVPTLKTAQLGAQLAAEWGHSSSHKKRTHAQENKFNSLLRSSKLKSPHPTTDEAPIGQRKGKPHDERTSLADTTDAAFRAKLHYAPLLFFSFFKSDSGNCLLCLSIYSRNDQV